MTGRVQMNANSEANEFTDEERRFINEAAQFFENPGLFAKGLNWIGKPIEYAQNKLPIGAQQAISRVTKNAITQALALSIKSIPSDVPEKSFALATKDAQASGLLHTGAATLVGGIGGFFGLAALPIELPIATLVMLRSIADIATHNGHDLNQVEARLECIYVFSLGSKSSNDDAMESAYYTSRVVFSEMLKHASTFIAGTTAKDIIAAIENGTAPILVTLVAEIASQLEIRVTKKMLAQTAPVVGALGGAGINLLFANFFKDCARYHFGLKKLEKEKGYEGTRQLFEDLRGKYREKLLKTA